MNFTWCSTFFYKEFYKSTKLNCIHFKGYRQHSCFRQLYKTNNLIEWHAISHGCLWQMYQLREKKIFLVLLPPKVEAENFSNRQRTFYMFPIYFHTFTCKLLILISYPTAQCTVMVYLRKKVFIIYGQQVIKRRWLWFQLNNI